MVRMKSKVIGTFRSEQGAIDFLLLKTGVEGYQFYPMYVMDLATVYYVQ